IIREIATLSSASSVFWLVATLMSTRDSVAEIGKRVSDKIRKSPFRSIIFPNSDQVSQSIKSQHNGADSYVKFIVILTFFLTCLRYCRTQVFSGNTGHRCQLQASPNSFIFERLV